MSNNLKTINFSETLSRKRLERAHGILGEVLTGRIIAFALYLLGAKREDISEFLTIPTNTLVSLFTRIFKRGVEAFKDGRASRNSGQPEVRPEKLFCEITEGANISIIHGDKDLLLNIPVENVLQRKVVLLTLAENGLLSRPAVSQALDISIRHVNNLKKKLEKDDASGLLDQRKGQIDDYKFTPGIKSKLIMQFVENAINGRKTSSKILEKDLETNEQLTLPARSIRRHISKLGMSGMGEKLLNMICSQKKPSENNCGQNRELSGKNITRGE